MRKTFPAFRTRFQELITAAAFGEPRNSDPNKRGAASKELSGTKLLRQLKSEDFCKRMYTLSEECWRLQAERPKAIGVGHRMRPLVHRYRNGAKRLNTCAQKLADFTNKYRGLLSPSAQQTIGSVVGLIETVVKELEQRRRILVANVHPKLRKGQPEQGEWRLLFKQYDYELETLGIKAVDQWFWTRVNDAILEFITEHEVANLSAITRFKLIAAISEATGRGTVPHTTIKQFLVRPRRKQNEPL